MTLRVQIVFDGEPFDRAAVIHTLRHLAMRVGWQLTLVAGAERRIVYATTDDANRVTAQTGDVVVLSSPAVAEHLRNSRAPIPAKHLPDGSWLPFPHRSQNREWICGDVIAGAFAALNLWYEERTRSDRRDGWIAWRDDWMARVGLDKPAALADEWLDEIARAAERLGWAYVAPRQNANFTVVLTHDVDYLPGVRDHGLPRLLRAIMRQVVLRRRPVDAVRLLAHYARSLSLQPYLAFESVRRAEQSRGARSSFQLVAARRHRLDPTYAIRGGSIASALQKVASSEWEICLHSSYMARRTPGALGEERAELERVVGTAVHGNRQHYLNFHPSQLFDAIERAGMEYDMSVGYNDASGTRAGTCFPYRPFNLGLGRAYGFWEISFVLMDTTLATTYRFSPAEALEHAQAVLSRVAKVGGSVSLIWHLEQLSGLVDPGFDQLYCELLDWIHAQGGAMVAGRDVLHDLNVRWRAAMCDE